MVSVRESADSRIRVLEKEKAEIEIKENLMRERVEELEQQLKSVENEAKERVQHEKQQC